MPCNLKILFVAGRIYFGMCEVTILRISLADSFIGGIIHESSIFCYHTLRSTLALVIVVSTAFQQSTPKSWSGVHVLPFRYTAWFSWASCNSLKPVCWCLAICEPAEHVLSKLPESLLSLLLAKLTVRVGLFLFLIFFCDYLNLQDLKYRSNEWN